MLGPFGSGDARSAVCSSHRPMARPIPKLTSVVSGAGPQLTAAALHRADNVLRSRRLLRMLGYPSTGPRNRTEQRRGPRCPTRALFDEPRLRSLWGGRTVRIELRGLVAGRAQFRGVGSHAATPAEKTYRQAHSSAWYRGVPSQ